MKAKNNNKNVFNVIENKETGWHVNEVLLDSYFPPS